MLKMEEILNSTVEITIIDPFSQCTYYLISKYDTCQYRYGNISEVLGSPTGGNSE